MKNHILCPLARELQSVLQAPFTTTFSEETPNFLHFGCLSTLEWGFLFPKVEQSGNGFQSVRI